MDDGSLKSNSVSHPVTFMSADHYRKPQLTMHHKIMLICFSLAYGYFLQALPLLDFLDRHNYLIYAEQSFDILVITASRGVLPLLSNEPVWLLINSGLAQIFEPEVVLRIIIFSAAALFSYSLLRVDPKNSLWLILFLLMPVLLKNHITHLRQGLAMALFYAGYFSHGSVRRILLITIAPFIHSSFFFILPIVILPAIFKRLRLAMDLRMIVFAGFAIFASLSLGVIATMLGARQSGVYNFEIASSVSGLGFVFWMMMGCLFVLQGEKYLKQNQEAIGVLVFYLVSYFFIEVTGRIFESGLPLVLLAGLALTGWRRWAFIASFLLYSSFQWLQRFSSPTLF